MHSPFSARPLADEPQAVSQPASKIDLTDQERQLVSLISRVSFGRIESILIRDGQPCLKEALVVRDLKLGADDNNERAISEDFRLKDRVIELIGEMRRSKDAIIRKVEVRHGLPVHLQIEEAWDAPGGGQ
jgi:hypothetical protein